MKKYFITSAPFLLSIFMLFACQLILHSQNEPDEETPRLEPYTEMDTALYQINCIPVSRVLAAHVLNFTSFSRLYVSIENPNVVLVNSSLRLKPKVSNQMLDLPVIWVDGFLMVQLSSNTEYSLMMPNSCGEWVTVREISTIRPVFTEPILVSEPLGDALSEWKMSESSPNLYTFLALSSGVSKFETYGFLQNFVKNGELLSNNYVSGIIPDEAFNPTEPDSEDCKCRVLNISMTSEAYPTFSGQLDPIIHPAVFPNQIIHETNKIKFWHAGSFEGPARYQQIWGETKRCKNTTESAKWGDNSSDALANALSRSVIGVQQICKQGNWTPGDCYCEQNISFKYRYDAQLDARTNLRGGACFNPPGKKAQAIVDDAVLVLVGRRLNPTNPLSTVPIYSSVNAQGVVSNCNKDFQETRILDVLKLGLAAYAYIKGIKIPIKNPAVNAVTNAVWDEYQKSLFFSSLENLLTQPWVTGSCTQVSTNHGLQGEFATTLNDREVLIFTMTAASYLEVNGMTAWDANARVLSGFSNSLVLEKNENVGQENAYCCTKPAGIYVTSTLHPLHGVNTYNQVIGAHFAPQLSCCLPSSPVNGQVLIDFDRDVMIGNAITNCETTINNQRTHQPLNAEIEDLQVYFAGDMLTVTGLKSDKSYQVDLLTVDGKLLSQNKVSGQDHLSIAGNTNTAYTGIYVVRIHDGTSLIAKKLIR